MRITNNMLISNMLTALGNNESRMSKYQNQLYTGKKIQLPSDDPIVAARALKLRTDVSKIEQYQKNLGDAQSWVDATDAALAQIGNILKRAKELSTQAANGTNSSSETGDIGQEMKQLKVQLVHIANSTYSGRYMFSGFQTDQKLIEDDETSTDFGKFKIGVNIVPEKIQFEIGEGDNININVTGGDVFNSGSNAVYGNEPSMIALFTNVIADLDSGNNTGVRNQLDKFDEQVDNLLRVRADIGARQNRIDLSADRMSNDLVNMTDLMSKNEDADPAETIMNLKMEENVYQASLAGGARIIQQTLVDFLR
ncbi:flagellar hook-associated protein 3 [Ruminiclostridium papyrosolvens DSM 2782]|uniref:Flagellar hook-associated protein 3 n=1 Tax=Ruminiclostridium papyrosolvens DSM 2782 TaxID=588581 RepID=F1TCP7_9FIRM|nr:flagellar hook-associated protein FlgL [Ruminiclostridium papyrosolvens]EGD47764.1 flagellar hook-associated protein 3 [Ruminiclostridium papyrosolvens DSM 2782]WES34481.1 flagellar hook-associated protein FlgL [Ruminiclostridium papyrosolvens DSM 2782]